MGTVLLVILIALVLGGVGLLVEALWWMLVIAGAFVLVGIVLGWRLTRQ